MSPPRDATKSLGAADAPPCVVFAGGGTGGHLFPGIAVACELRRRHPDWSLHFVGTARGIEVAQVPRYGFPLHLLPVQPLRGRGLWGAARGLWALPQAQLAARALVRRLRPRLAVGVGGYAAGPAILAARAAGVRCAILEQNAHAGLTNRILATLAHQVLLALPNPQLDSPRARVVGNPVRADIGAARGTAPPSLPQRFDAARPLRVFAFGGSQGARALNDALVAAMPLLASRGAPVTLLHQTGVAQHADVAAAYARAGLGWARAVPFVDDMAKALAEADVLVCRAGAGTLAEATVVGKASLLVPYPHAADDHQTANAKVLVAAGAARLLPEATLTPAALATSLAELGQRPNDLAAMARAAWALGKPDAAAAIADEFEREVHRVS